MNAVVLPVVEKQADGFPGDTDDFPALVLLASRMEPEMRRQFLAAIRESRLGLTVEFLEQALQTGTVTSDVKQALRLLDTNLDQRFRSVLRKAFLRGAEFAVDRLTQAQIAMRMDMVSPHAVAWASSYTPQLADKLVEGGAENVQRLIQESVEDGIPPRAIARRIRDHVGLTAPDSRALRRFIREVQGQGVAQTRVEMRASRMAMAMIRRRAETIARTEIMRAHNMGQQGAWNEAASRRLISPTTKRRFVVTWDELLCPFCESIAGATALLNGNVWSVGGDVVLTNFSGPPAHPKCRCTTVLVL